MQPGGPGLTVSEELRGRRDPFLQGGPAGEPEVPEDRGAIENASALLAGRQGDVIGGLAVVEGAGDRGEEVVDRGFDAGSQVPRAGLSALQGAGGRLDEVADVDVIAGLPAVAADFRAPSGQDRLAEDRDDSGLAHAVLAGSVDVSVAEDLGLESVDYLVVVEVFLDRKLGAAVRRDRVRRVGLGRRPSSPGLSVQRAPRGREEDPADPGPSAGLEELERTEDVRARVVERIGDAVAEVDLRGVVGNEVDPFFPQKG